MIAGICIWLAFHAGLVALHFALERRTQARLRALSKDMRHE